MERSVPMEAPKGGRERPGGDGAAAADRVPPETPADRVRPAGDEPPADGVMPGRAGPQVDDVMPGRRSGAPGWEAKFEAAWGLGRPHFQTVVSRFVRTRRDARYRRTRIETPDGDFLDLDVWEAPAEPVGACLLLHGLEGSARSGYMVTTSEALAAAGIQPVSLNFRSCGGEPNRLPRAYHSGETGDITFALTWLAERFHGLPLACAGFSLGGSALLNLLGREPDATGLAAAVAVSVPYDLTASAERLDRGHLRLYGRRFLKSLAAKAREKAERFPDIISPEAARARTLREFDDRLTAPLHGFANALDYYTRCSSARFIPFIRAPTLLVHALDDPLAPASSLPPDAAGHARSASTSEASVGVPVDSVSQAAGGGTRPPNITLRLTRRGGHLGFLDRALLAGHTGWLERCVTCFLSAHLRDGAPARDDGRRTSGAGRGGTEGAGRSGTRGAGQGGPEGAGGSGTPGGGPRKAASSGW